MEEIERTAYHEAAHAVADIRRGCGVLSVSIAPDSEKGTLGSECGYDDWHSEDEARTYVRALLAGFAMNVLCEPETRERALCGAATDFEMATPVIYLIGGSLDAALADAAAFVQSERVVIEALAKELIEHRVLDHDEVELLVEGASGDSEAFIALANYRALRAAGSVVLSRGPAAR